MQRRKPHHHQHQHRGVPTPRPNAQKPGVAGPLPDIDGTLENIDALLAEPTKETVYICCCGDRTCNIGPFDTPIEE